MKLSLALLLVFVAAFVAGNRADQSPLVVPVESQVCRDGTLYVKARGHVYTVPKAWASCPHFTPSETPLPERRPV